MRRGEKNPEIRPSCELPLFEQNFYKFEQQHSALPEIPAVASFVPPVANEGGEHTGLSARRQLRESHGEQNNQAIAHGVEPSQLREEVPMRDESQKPSGLELAQVAAKSVPPNTNRGASNLNRNNLENRKTRRGGGEIHRSSADIESCLTAPLSAHGESGDCLSGAQPPCSPRDVKSGLSAETSGGVQCETGERPRRSNVSSFSPDSAHARNSDPETSHQAARSISLENLGRTRNAILRLLKAFPSGLTDEQLIETYREAQAVSPQNFWNATDSGIRSRRADLVRWGFVCEAGMGETKSKRACTIWKLTPVGEQK